MNWEKGPLIEFGEDAVLAIVETNGGAEFYLCRVDHGGMLVDLQHGDDYGWSAEDVDRWVSLGRILEELGGGE